MSKLIQPHGINYYITLVLIGNFCDNCSAMIAKVYSATNIGFDGKLIEVECDTSNGLPNLLIVGLGNKAIDEAKERVRSAIKNAKLDFPKKRITINLAPANLPKYGAHFDLPIAIALLVVSGQIPKDSIRDTLFVGELALNGDLRPIPSAITFAEVAKRSKINTLILPTANAQQASMVKGIKILPAKSLTEVVAHLKKISIIPASSNDSYINHIGSQGQTAMLDAVYGHEQAKRALIIAAAGRHNILLSGPPGSGKTMLAKSLLSILPPLNSTEIIEVTKLHSMAGENTETVVQERPFRSPHHSASHIALTGGGTIPRPGEISLAHHGVLFMDELPEYSRQALEALRQPLEDRYITIARVNSSLRFPADFMLIATQNPCPCGFASDTERECTCRPYQIENYQKKISGPLLDRIDMTVEVGRVDPTKLLRAPKADTLYKTRLLIQNALQMQRIRFGSPTKTNSNMSSRDVVELSSLDPAAKALLEKASKTLQLSARGYFKTIKIARTIADLSSDRTITTSHIAEALQFRPHNNT